MVWLMTAANAMEARIIAARLGAEGIVWEFRGSVDGPLALGPVEVLVDADGYESARELLALDDVDGRTMREVRETTGRDVLSAALALLALALFAIARMTSQY
jgi:hypothetical protein